VRLQYGTVHSQALVVATPVWARTLRVSHLAQMVASHSAFFALWNRRDLFGATAKSGKNNTGAK
jgi:hypothetical protein